MSAEGYEVIFYEDEVEHIATYSREGQLHTLLINLSPAALPDPVRRYALSRGEIMNAISMKEGDRVSYELIVRDGALERYALLFDAGGTLLKEEHL